IRPQTNEVVIGENEDLFVRELYADHINFMAVPDLQEKNRFLAKIRYAHRGAECTIEQIDTDVIRCVFDEPQRAITPGQALVFYDGEYVAGGGTIIGTHL
ncbi:MAG: aminomethyltransferase beta-barrel domain-containing protein, partial [Lachnospiraceae bacterium]